MWVVRGIVVVGLLVVGMMLGGFGCWLVVVGWWLGEVGLKEKSGKAARGCFD